VNAAKLPKGLPALPDAPTGCVWEYMGKHWQGEADNYIFAHDADSFWRLSDGIATGGPCHYCRAIKRPAKLKKPKRVKAVNQLARSAGVSLGAQGAVLDYFITGYTRGYRCAQRRITSAKGRK